MAKLSHNEIAESIYSLTHDKSGKELKESLEKVVAFLHRKRLISQSERILETLQKIINKKARIVEVGIKSASEISNHTKKELKEILAKKYHAEEIILKEVVDKSLLGGLKVEVNDEVIDLTLRSKVSKLQDYLIRTI